MSSYAILAPERNRNYQNTAEKPNAAEVPDPDWWFQVYRKHHEKSAAWFFKRMLDIGLSGMALLALSPLLLLVMLAIMIESPGSPIYRQKRIGLRGQEFDMYKLRSMRPDADKQLEKLLAQNQTNEGMFKLFDDPRVTRVGKFIRKYSIDELPQLVNVIQGDMSLVGPRPPIEREVKTYKPWHHVRFATLPVLTGVWQTSGRSHVEKFDDVVRMDYDYIRNWSLLLDMQLILKTIPVVILGKDSA